MLRFPSILPVFLQKQKKLSVIVHEMCSEISHSVGKLVHAFGRIDEKETETDRAEPSKVGTSRQHSKKRREQQASDSEEALYQSDTNGSNEGDSDFEESDDDADKTASDSGGDSGDEVRSKDGGCNPNEGRVEHDHDEVQRDNTDESNDAEQRT